MKIFSPLYDLAMRWSKHPHAPRYLYGMSFIESIFWPVPVDVMLAPMSLAKPERAWIYAFWTTIASVAGAVLGYFIGWYLFDSVVVPFTESIGWTDKLDVAKNLFVEYGVWIVFIAGFTPIPYKVFAVSAGFMHMAIVPFILASLLGRGARFFLVSALMYWGGEKMEQKLRQYVDILGWLVIALAVVAYFVLRG